MNEEIKDEKIKELPKEEKTDPKKAGAEKVAEKGVAKAAPQATASKVAVAEVAVTESKKVEQAEQEAVARDAVAAKEAVVREAAAKAIVAKKVAVAKEVAAKALASKVTAKKPAVAKYGTELKPAGIHGKGLKESGRGFESRSAGDASELIEKIVKTNRVAKVVKGGRRFSFNALVVVGDGQGKVGSALGKANEITDAIRKGIQKASGDMRKVAIHGRTVPHAVRASFGASRVVIKPCQPGRGIVSSGAVRAVMEAVGIHDISVKTLGSNNPYNSVKATLGALYNLKSFKEIADRRGFSEDRLRQAAKISAS